MAEPSNIRINPFTGTGGATNYVELTEKHIVPANSPYVIRLNEVPEKQDPSNIKMVYVDSATGAATSTTLTEVAATPGQGEFRMDYTTNAMDDKTWNTGLVEFSAADAGKIIQITYTGTGILAAVNSNHWPSWYTDRGDGSDGDFVPIENTTISGVKNYKSVFIKSGITVTCSNNTWIKCQNIFINNGIINVLPSGGFGGTPPRLLLNDDLASGNAGESGTCSTGGSGGANSGDNRPVVGAGGGIILTTDYLNAYGAGGGSGLMYGPSAIWKDTKSGVGGRGGGRIIITAKNISNNSIYAKGGTGTAGISGGVTAGGGGGGGFIGLIADAISKNGNLDVSGGLGGSGAAKGSGGITLIKELGVI